MTNTYFTDLSKEDLGKLLNEIGEPSYRVKQIFDWYYKKNIKYLDNMTNLSKQLRAKLSERILFNSPLNLIESEEAEDRATKYLLATQKGTIQCVAIPSEPAYTLCISSQTACQIGCAFCASSDKGESRNLTVSEIISQVLLVTDLLCRPGHIVFMGIGEPFLNYDNVLKAVRILIDPDGYNLGARRITISTAGIVPEIYRFAEEGLQVNLAVSLNAPTDSLRQTLMPISNIYHIDQILKAVKYYTDKTHRQLTFEYVLIQNVNNSKNDAIKLSALASDKLLAVNIIPYNNVHGRKYQSPSPESVKKFLSILHEHKVHATTRKSRGSKIDAACGQLRISIR